MLSNLCQGGGQLERISSGIYIEIYSRCVLVFLAMITSHNLQSLIRLYANLGIINNFKFVSGGDNWTEYLQKFILKYLQPVV